MYEKHYVPQMIAFEIEMRNRDKNGFTEKKRYAFLIVKLKIFDTDRAQ